MSHFPSDLFTKGSNKRNRDVADDQAEETALLLAERRRALQQGKARLLLDNAKAAQTSCSLVRPGALLEDAKVASKLSRVSSPSSGDKKGRNFPHLDSFLQADIHPDSTSSKGNRTHEDLASVLRRHGATILGDARSSPLNFQGGQHNPGGKFASVLEMDRNLAVARAPEVMSLLPESQLLQQRYADDPAILAALRLNIRLKHRLLYEMRRSLGGTGLAHSTPGGRHGAIIGQRESEQQSQKDSLPSIVVPLSSPNDRLNLSVYQMRLRMSLEFFNSMPEDITASVQGRKGRSGLDKWEFAALIARRWQELYADEGPPTIHRRSKPFTKRPKTSLQRTCL